MFRLASVLLLLLFTYQFIAQAADASGSSTTPREEEPSSCVDCPCHPQRTLYNIIWGCVSTTIICTWAALHPHIPPREGPFKAALRRLELLFWTILAPECLPACALNQRLAAGTIRDWYNEKKGYQQGSCGIRETLKRWASLYEVKEADHERKAWTLKHGHFLIMGGIRLVEPFDPSTPEDAENEPSGMGRETILTFEMLQDLVNDPELEIRITENEITERAKGDALSKIIFTLQTSWFLLQCLARLIQGLNISQLELTTLALASVNGITFILWWDKPLGLQAVVRIYLKRKLTDAERKVAGRGHSRRSETVPYLKAFFKSTVIVPIILSPSKGFVDWLIGLPVVVATLVSFPIIAFATAALNSLADVALEGASSFPADATHVPTIYSPVLKPNLKYLHTFLLLILASIFGVIHCTGWNFPFPTYTERTLWRFTSLALAVLPFALVFVLIIAIRLKPGVEVEKNDIIYLAFLIFTLLYVCARGVLLVQAIALLRQPPRNAFTIVNWTQFYPHIF